MRSNGTASTSKPFVAYGQSKTSSIYIANEIERRFGEQAMHGLSLHPGGIRTGLQKHMDQEMVKGWDVSGVPTLSVSGIRSVIDSGLQTDAEIQKWSKIPAQGAGTTVFAARSKEKEGRGGVCLADCGESVPFESGGKRSGIVYKPYANDKEAARRLWDVSLEMIRMSEQV